jgi:hypothetical protein
MPNEPTDRAGPMQGLTNERIIEIAKATESAEPGRDGYILPISFARAIEAEVEASRQRPAAQAASAERREAATARPPSDDEPWVVSDDTGVRVTFRDEDAAWRYRNEYTDRLENPTVTHEPATPAQAASAEPTAAQLAAGALFPQVSGFATPAAPAQAAVMDEKRATIQAAIDALMETDRDCDYPLIDKLNELLAQASPAHPAQEPDYPLWSEPIHAAQDSIASASPQESAAAARKDAEGVQALPGCAKAAEEGETPCTRYCGQNSSRQPCCATSFSSGPAGVSASDMDHGNNMNIAVSDSDGVAPAPAAQRFIVTSIKHKVGIVTLCTLNAEDVQPPLEAGQEVALGVPERVTAADPQRNEGGQ